MVVLEHTKPPITNLAGDPGLQHGGDAADYRLVIPTRRLHLESSMGPRLLLCLRSFVAEGITGVGRQQWQRRRIMRPLGDLLLCGSSARQIIITEKNARPRP